MRKVSLALVLAAVCAVAQPKVSPEKLSALKADLAGQIDGMQKQAQVMVDSVYSFAELGFQEWETSKYLSGILEQNGFKVERGIAGIPTAFMATWGSGKPVVSFGSDFDCLPETSQKPGIAWHEEQVKGAPGHGEGHNTGVPMNMLAAIALKKVMEREHLSGTLQVWPGVAEELVGAKAHYVRAGYFKNVDAVLWAHVAANLNTGNYGWAWNGNALVSVRYDFTGSSAHAAGSPWRGVSAVDAATLMGVGWEFQREHMALNQRSHWVYPSGGFQPNVMPPSGSIWFYFRQGDYERVMDMWKRGDDVARGAALMTRTEWTSSVLGTAWPSFVNKPLAEAEDANVRLVGLPKWSDDDEKLAVAVQKEVNRCCSAFAGKVAETGMAKQIPPFGPSVKPATETGGGSDDFGDVSWNVPSASLRYPANFQAGPGHSWINGIAEATPIAHKGVIAGAKVQAMTALDILVNPDLVKQAKEWFDTEQIGKYGAYKTFLRPDDKPCLECNKRFDADYRPEQKKLYYDASKYNTYLEQLGIKYPTIR